MAINELVSRTYSFAVKVGKLTERLPNSLVNRAYCAQIIRSSSSVYANYKAAQRAKSEKDFINKLKIVEEECDETVCFLELLKAFNEMETDEIEILIDEGTQLLKIFVASINKMRDKLKSAKPTMGS
jgi:four helix bundle protein